MGVGLLQGGVLTGKSHIASSSEIAKIACYTLCKTLKCSGTVLEVLLRCLQPKLVLVFCVIETLSKEFEVIKQERDTLEPDPIQ